MEIINVQQAASLIPDGSAVVISGFVVSAVPEYVLAGIEQSFLQHNHPRSLTTIWNAGTGDSQGNGVDHLGHQGLTARAICAHCNLVPKLQAMIDHNEIPAHILPLGCMSELYREIGANRPGLFSKVGLGTFVDPRHGGGKANACTKEDLVEVVTIQGEEYLFYHKIPMDVAIIRGTTIDMHGNMTCEDEPCISDMLSIAQAVKHNGGIVIAQVQNVCEYGSLKAREVIVPGFMIDYAVVAPPEGHPATYGHPAGQRAWTNQFRIPLTDTDSQPLTERKIIARRAAMELKKGQLVNLGFGVPETIAAVAAEEGFSQDIILSVEVGHVGGVPLGGADFGACINPDYVVDTTRQMDWYDGGALDCAFLGAAEVDQYGNANVTKFGKTVGPGGFINIASTAKKVCYCGALTAGGLKTAAHNGKLQILQEGRKKKYVSQVEQISFSGPTAFAQGQEVLYITERTVFRLTEKGLELIEIAPGIDLKTQVLPFIDFPVHLSPDLKEMDTRIFTDAKMGLKI